MRWFGKRDKRERRLERELRDHLELETENQGGDSYAARRAIGNLVLIKEDTRSEWGGMWLEQLWQDLRYAGRSMQKRPAFFASAILILGVGIGINVAVFSLVRNVIFDPLPIPDPDELVVITKESQDGTARSTGVALGDFLELRERYRSASQVAAYFFGRFDVSGTEPYRALGPRISANFLEMFGAQPMLGRNLSREVEGDALPEVILGHQQWQDRFGGDPDVIGTSMTLSGEIFTVVGVMGPEFRFARLVGGTTDIDIWLSLPQDEEWRSSRGASYVNVFVRLNPEVPLAPARAELETISAQFAADQPDVFGGKVLAATPLRDRIVGDSRLPLLMLWGAVLCVLLITCANLANMLLTHAMTRRKEFSVRLGLGASRGRVVRQLLTESVMLAMCGGALGLGLAWALVQVLPTIPLTNIPRLNEVRLDPGTTLFALALALPTGLVFGTFPAWRGLNWNPEYQLRESARTTDGRRTRFFRAGLVIVQVSFALMLLVGAGLLIRSFVVLLESDRGFRPEKVLTLDLLLPQNRYAPEAAEPYFSDLRRRITSLPEVTQVGAVSTLPLALFRWGWFYLVEEHPLGEGTPVPGAEFGIATPGFFASLGIPITAGREFNERDVAEGQPVGLVNEAFARLNWPGEDPIGKRFRRQGALSPEWVTVVGVASDLPYAGIDQPAPPAMYEPLTQKSERSMTMVIRTSGDPLNLAGPVRALVRQVDPAVVIVNLRPMEALVSGALQQRRLVLTLLGTFAGLALFLATFGIYSVISYGATQRTPEIGVRVALGARYRDILNLVLREGVILTIAGIGMGLFGAFMLSSLISGLLYGIEPTDTATIIVVSSTLFAVALLACYLPSRRAARVDPMLALRHE